MTSGGNSFSDIPEIVPTREITTEIQKTFLLVVRDRGQAYFLNGPTAAASIAHTFIRRCV